ncbi:MAG: hypothetical protein AB9835_06315 [Eubacteriales bacterium]
MKKLILISLTFCILIFSACQPDKAINTSTTGTDAVPTTADATQESTVAPPELPDKDYSGRTFTILTFDTYNRNFNLSPEDEIGETLNDAAYRRNAEISEKYGIEFKCVESNDCTKNLKSSVMTGDSLYNMLVPQVADFTPMLTNQLLYNWTDVPYIDLSKPWWNQSVKENLTVGDKLFYVSGDIAMTYQGLMAIIFNKDLMAKYGIKDDLYQLVYDGKWTHDKRMELIKDKYADLNGDGNMGENDQYGYIMHSDTGGDTFFSMGQTITKRDENGIPVLNLNTPRMVNIVQKFYDLVYSGNTLLEYYTYASFKDSAFGAIFNEGRALFIEFDIGGLYNELRGLEYDFGILPTPKFDESQEDYISLCGAGLIAIPTIVDDPEFTGIIAEEMAYRSYLYLRPAFFDTVLQSKVARDEDSYNVLNMLQQNKVFDFGNIFDPTQLTYGMLKKVVIEKKGTDFTSYYESVENKIKTGLDKILELYK